jgi:hypothetical protein
MSEKLPYEFHVTVDALNTNTSEFIDTCSEIGAKAIVLDLGINNGTVLSDCMTSSTKLLENDNEAFCELYRIDDALSNKGFKVIRRKIETTPWHSLAPQTDGDLMPEGSYFESHLAIATTPEQISGLREGLIETADILPLHLSRNVFKKINDGQGDYNVYSS